MTTTEDWTILRLLEWTSGFLKEKGFESPRLEAEILLSAARECSRIDLYTAFNEVASDEVRTAFRELVRRRGEGTPVAYLVGHREFYSRKFRVTPDVLIPRPETEFIILRLLDLVAGKTSQPWKVVDVGTGSGIVAINAALELPSASVTAIDISPAALAVAQKNATDHEVTDRLEFIEGSVLSSLPPEPVFDFVLSNPPYIMTSEYAELDSHVKDHEPKLALEAGEFGTDVIEKLIPQSAERLKPGGWLMMEISPMIASRVNDLIISDGRYGEPHTTKDLSQLARVVSAQRVD